MFSYTFCDFGNQFDVLDVDGEEAVELFIADITKVCGVWSAVTGPYHIRPLSYTSP